ncbi:UDP-N-acetylmuramoyl-L-alanyl-D-glutamate--2,6-diaminopimelate ligase [Flavobacterium sp. xlx-214]|uniref:UDP-N-acetylmuramoyl-L-alanyl-D-glutamate--2, 6-diaminopimelate ligase n=1 Tax=unclassified Flavobacterium TaxID=196869 RepID=UPI0013D775E0|nr:MULTISPECIES: UDP-N-acetylmuramoyl-L-alanyl-D-glutamate--2,6-diaminopimelate ligase [unclassified Flavobacterium]MBA5791927.1 UDP-N-acetylmuramoyl-L-alanyl-D-glutamate--2,6-diaminopimelate ligase [Flavobacterium sp. xlx-221]QMI84183.1 UDP-N-acetylmuramoyl-L-alanyl-D-glutamate--2,6-diaminopimelate ligase [Flavobacterium sp. xlx-214]
MKKLKDILYRVSLDAVRGTTDVVISDIVFDSRKVTPSSAFIAQKGTLSNGHDYIEKAIELGAIAVIYEDNPATFHEGITYVKVDDANDALAHISANFFDNPSSKLTLVGVTGTNGKTTIATLLHQLFTKAGYKVGLLSTVKILVGDTTYPATHTTPDSITINRFLNQMVQEGCTHCFMEVSSHGIAQKRTAALDFKGGIFTNLSHDHLDYHKTFAEYRNVKKSFFDSLAKTSFAISNADDKNGAFMLQNCSAKKVMYSIQNVADINGKIIESQFNGMLLNINHHEVWVQLIGKFNASNLLAIYATATELGLTQEEVLLHLSTLKSVSGRFQFIVSPSKITAIVDYAHTPDALENVLKTITEIRTLNEQLITVVGCGGNRDKEKRPVMARIATEMSDTVIFTSDNPRNEDPYEILKDMEAGVEAQNTNRYITIEDRHQAIKTACKMANAGDIILIAGKGHEDYQEIKGVKHHFNDLEEVIQFLNEFNK